VDLVLDGPRRTARFETTRRVYAHTIHPHPFRSFYRVSGPISHPPRRRMVFPRRRASCVSRIRVLPRALPTRRSWLVQSPRMLAGDLSRLSLASRAPLACCVCAGQCSAWRKGTGCTAVSCGARAVVRHVTRSNLRLGGKRDAPVGLQLPASWRLSSLTPQLPRASASCHLNVFVSLLAPRPSRALPRASTASLLRFLALSLR